MQHMREDKAKRALFVGLLTVLSLGLGLLSTPAQAVTNGQLVPDPKSSAPYVVSIWTTTDSNDYKDAEFLCTGTLIGPQVVLTAAHCTTYTTPYFVKVGADSLNDQTPFTQVSAIWTSPRYNPKTFTNDVGLLKLTDRFENIEFPTLASPKIAKSINKFSKLKIFGWGLDQNKELAELLRASNLTIQDTLAKKAFGKYFNVQTMLSAGRKIPAENIWSGACSGDSGGPLLTEINSINVIVGITSWGAKNCIPNKPSIFARVSYYENDIKLGIKDLETQSKVVDRTAPVASIEPELIGQAKPGSSLKCSTGSWKNAISIKSTWISPARISGSNASDVAVLASDGSSIFRCEVIISSAKASVRRVLTTSITGSAAISSNPVISGISSSVVKSGTIARCEGWNWRSPVDNERVTWFTSSSSQPSVPVNGRQIGSGTSLTLDSSLLRGENGRYLICQVTGSKDGFESHFIASKYLTTPSAPTISSVSVNASSLATGSSATCSFNSYSDVESTRIDWGYTSVSGYFTQYLGLSGEQIQLTSDLVQQAAGKYLACRVTLSNSGGEVSKSANTYNSFASLPNTPTVNASISGSITAGNIARCSTDSINNYGSNLTYAWGKTSSSGSRLIEGEVYSRSTSYTLTSTSLDDLAGAFLTCVVTLKNDAGSVSSASSISIPSSKTTLPQPSTPSVESQISSTLSISVKIRVPSISGFDSSKMIAKLNVINTPNCTNLNVTPGSAYDCTGLSANTTYTANVSVASTSGVVVTNTSSNVSFTTIGLGLSPALIPTHSAITSTTNGFEFRILNYDTQYTWVVEFSGAPQGDPTASVSINASGIVTVTALRSGASASVLVKTSRKDYSNGSTLITGSSISQTNTLRIIATEPDSDGITNVGICFTNPSALSGTVTYNISGASSGSFLKHSGTPACPSFASGSTGLRLTPDTTYNYSATASNNGVNYSATLSHRTPAATTLPGLTPVFGARTPDYYSPGFKYQIANYDPAYTWTVTSTVGTATINSSGLVSVAPVGAKQSATLTVSTRRTGYTSASASVTSVGPWNLSDEIQTQNITATLSGTTLTVNVPDARGWTWGLIWDGGVQRANITSFPYTVTGFSTNKNIQLTATDNLQNYGYSRVFLPTVAATTLPGLTPVFGARTPDYYSPGFKYQIANYDPAYTWTVTSTVGTATINSSGLVSVAPVGAKQSATLTVSTRRTGYTSASASVTSVGPWNLSDEIQTQNITATLSGTTLTVNVPDARGWTWGLIWDGGVQRANITSFPYTVTGFSTNKNIQLTATDNLQNYGYSRVFLPTLTSTPSLGPVVATNNVYIAVPSLAVGAQQSIEFSISSTLEVVLAQLWIYDSAGQSVTIVRGNRSAGTNLNGTWKFDFNVPSNLPSGSGGAAVAKGNWSFKGNANDSAGNGSSTGSWVDLGRFTVE